ncbi:MAG: sulfate permease [Rhodothermales bacterium]|nr:sulfate permease [Rhodothermales bacterium]
MSRLQRFEFRRVPVRRFLTIADWLPSYSFSTLRHDLIAGLTVSVILIPQAMAYALLAGVPPVYGLYASIVPLLVYPLFGTSRHIALGITAIDALIISAAVSLFATPMTPEYIALVIVLALITGIIQLGLGLFKLGFVVNLLSGPVITGFMAAAALTISVSQLKYIAGVSIDRSSSVIETVGFLFSSVGETHLPTLALGVSSIVILALLVRFVPRAPGPLIVAVIATLAVWLLKMNDVGVSVVGEISAGLPALSAVELSFSNIRNLTPAAITLALVQFMAVMSLGKMYAAKHRYIIKPNRELISIGMSNIVGSFFKSMPVSASFARSAVNERAGSSTPAANAIAAMAVALAIMFLTGLLFYLPEAALAAIIIVTVLGLIDIERVKFLFRAKRVDGLIAVVTFLATLVIGITEGVVIGITASVIAIMYRISRPNVAELGHLPGTRSFRSLDRYPEAERIEGVIILRVDASFSFVNADFLRDLLLERSVLEADIREIVIDASSINDLDTSAATALASAARTLRDREIEIYFGGVKDPVLDTMRLCGLLDQVGEDHFFLSPHRAIQDILDKREQEKTETENDPARRATEQVH